MRKRLLSILVACCMVLTMIPVTVFATETEGPAASAAPAAEGDALAEGLEGLGADLGEQLGEQLGEPQGQPEEQPGQPEGQPEAKPATEAQAEQGLAPQAAPSAGEPVVLNDEDENALANAAEKEVSTADELTAAIADSAVTAVKLAANIDFNGTLTVHRAVTLDLNGFTLKFTNPDQIPITTYGRSDSYTENYPIGILVDSWDGKSAHLTLADGSETATGKLEMTGVDDNAIFVTDGELTMTGGTITNSYSGEIGYAHKMTGIGILRGKASMTGGRIEKQRQMGVWVCASTFTMGGNAVISGCGIAADTKSAGGGVLVNDNCAPYWTGSPERTRIPSYFTLEGGARIENCAATYGGGVSVGDNCLFTMTGGSITGCTADYEGGGVVTEGSGPESTSEVIKPVFIMSGGSISDCKAGDTNGGTGGGVSVGARIAGTIGLSMFEMIGGTITGCKAANGGGVNIQGSSSFTMTNGSITGCEGLLGGGVELRQAYTGVAPTVFTMSGGSITGCKAADTTDNVAGLGGGVYMGSGCQLAMSGNARITGCEAARSGSGIYGTKDGSESSYSPPLLTRSDNAQVDKGVSMDYTLQVGSGIDDFQTVRMDGLGTETYPYEIGTADQLKLFQQIVNGVQTDNEAAVLPPQNLGACAVLTADIDLGGEAWTPIGTLDKPYAGTFDGQRHAISGLSVSGDLKAAGLFGYTKDAVIRNLTVSGSVTSTNESGYVGGIVGHAAEGSIENCVNLCTVNGSFAGGYAGGIAGHANGGAIENCGNLCTVNGSAAGGIIGGVAGATVSACYNAGGITGDWNVGGIAGDFIGDEDGGFYDCYNVGTVHGEVHVGGIVGVVVGKSPYNCYNVGAVTGTSDISGIGYDTWSRSSYYLKGTAADRSATEKTAEEFADGTVLKALINDRADGEHPWDTEGCKFLSDDAETELPVLAWQNLPATPTVTFDTDGGSEVESQSVRCGNTVQEPAAPTKPGYTFAGWCTDADRTEIYDFGTPVEESFTLYAKWTANAETGESVQPGDDNSPQPGDNGGSQTGDKSSPRTGDNSNVALWGGLLLVSACGLASATILGRRKRAK